MILKSPFNDSEQRELPSKSMMEAPAFHLKEAFDRGPAMFSNPNRLSLCLLLGIAILSLSACKGAQTKEAATKPDWVDNGMELKRGLAAVGVATSFEQAQDRALAGLADIVKVRLSSVVNDYVKFTEGQSVEISSQSYESMTSAGISGAVLLGRYKDEGTFHVLMGVRDPRQVMSTLTDEIATRKGDREKAKSLTEKELIAVYEARTKCGLSGQ
jgi:hypothetical protein